MHGNTVSGVGLSIKNNTRQSQVLYVKWHPTPSIIILCKSGVNGALTDLLFCIGKISSKSSDGQERDVCKQIEAIVADSLLPQEWGMEYLKR